MRDRHFSSHEFQRRDQVPRLLVLFKWVSGPTEWF